MKSASALAVLASAARLVSGHATFQDLCARLPLGIDPVYDIQSNDLRCNAGTSPAKEKCEVAGGSTVTVEMHQPPHSVEMGAPPYNRSCANGQAIAGRHYGPVAVYMSAVADSAAADGADPWFKIFADTWAPNTDGETGDDDHWGTKDLNACCGKMDVRIPEDLAPGDYLLRAEALALHIANDTGHAEFYMTCYQLTLTEDGSGSGGGGTAGTARPSGVSLPGAYAADDPGIFIDIHQPLTTYEAPGPTVYRGGTTKSAGSPCVGCESSCTAAP